MNETARLGIESSVFDGRVLLGLDGLSESAGVQQASSDVVVEVAEAEGYAP